MYVLVLLTILGVISAFPREIWGPAGTSIPRSDPFTYISELKNRDISPRIINGDEAKPGSFPHQVGLKVEGFLGYSFCGGSLISEDWILTAAHCLTSDYGINYITVILGAHDINYPEAGSVTTTTTIYVSHPLHNPDKHVNDIGLVRLLRSVQLTDNIKPIALPSIDDVKNTYAGQTATVSGWGVTQSSGSEVNEELRYLTSTIMTNEECAAIPPFGTVLTDVHLCLSGRNTLSGIEKVVSVCSGDSGGGLIVNNTVVGVVSFTLTECDLGEPNVFARVTSFLPWILDQIEF